MHGRSIIPKASSWSTPGRARICSKSGKSLHPYVRWEVAFRIDREQEIGPQLRALGIASRDVKRVVLTHLHMDHDGGLAHFPESEILVASGELKTARGYLGRLRGYLPHRWPSWFDPKPLNLAAESFGPFAASRRLTQAGDVVAVATPGHTADHISVVVQDGGIDYFLAGDTSYNEDLMLEGRLDGVSADEQVTIATLDAIRRFARSRPTVYCRRTIPRPPVVWRTGGLLRLVKCRSPTRRPDAMAELH